MLDVGLAQSKIEIELRKKLAVRLWWEKRGGRQVFGQSFSKRFLFRHYFLQ